MGVGLERVTSISKSNQRSQFISVLVDDIARYSASVEERDTISCFLLFQKIRESSRKIQKHVDFRIMESPAQSTSEQACNSNEDDEANKRL